MYLNLVCAVYQGVLLLNSATSATYHNATDLLADDHVESFIFPLPTLDRFVGDNLEPREVLRVLRRDRLLQQASPQGCVELLLTSAIVRCANPLYSLLSNYVPR